MAKDIRQFSLEELKDLMVKSGEPAYRANQVFDWVWKKSVLNPDLMTNLPLSTRKALIENFPFHHHSIHKQQKSSDGTIKTAIKLYDGNIVECVLIPTEDRMTACVSSQVGCSLTCKFCATGYMDRVRNLEPFEIFDQVVEVKNQAKEHFDMPLTNIVFMGMGEPLLNYANTLSAIEKITSPDGLGMASKRITVSTAGIAKMIKKLGDDQVKFNLALSLHAANDEKRNQVMPINESNTLNALKEALLYFFNKTRNSITLEYILFNNFNDTLQDAKELLAFAKSVPSKINIIEYNPIAEAQFKNSESQSVDQFAQFLREKNVVVNIRKSRGKDIDAACGQLANKG